MASSFGDRLRAGFDARGQLCVGIDPHASLLTAWDLTDSVHGLREFSLRVVEACSGLVAVIKPQISFFERFGAKGFEVLEEASRMAESEGLLVIADAKRGDIGTTMEAYLEAWFGETSGLFADALTVSPYLGLETISVSMDRWIAKGKGVYSLVATSNPEGASVQLARLNEQTLASQQWSRLAGLNSQALDLGNYGAVLGATLDLNQFEIDKANTQTPILAPGFGVQGAKLAEANAIYGKLSGSVAYSVSRSVLQVGPRDLRSAIESANSELFQGLKSVG